MSSSTSRRAARTQARQEAEETRAAAPGKIAPGLSREDLKRIKREQAEQRNALYKKLRPLQAKYEEKEKALEEVLTRHDEVEKLLADPDIYADGAKATALLKEFHDLEERSEKGLEELGELEAQIAELEAQRAALSLDGGEQ